MKYFRSKVFGVVLQVLLIVSSVLVAVSCTPQAEPPAKLGVVVTILPQAEFVEKVGGERVSVSVMVPPGASPHTYEPTPGQMAELAQAKMYAQVGSGVEFELAWMDRLAEANKAMLVVDCAQGIQLQETVTGSEEESDEHGALDPHIWMSPRNAQIMVQNIARGLIQIDPDNQAYYEQNRDAYLQELGQLNQDIASGLSGVENRVFMVYHPAFGYFAREYDLTMLPIEDEGKEPTPAGLAHLIDQAQESNIKVVFASPQFNPNSARVIADAIDGRVVLVDPLARDYLTNLRILQSEMMQAME